jgi:hypothetical protein
LIPIPNRPSPPALIVRLIGSVSAKPSEYGSRARDVGWRVWKAKRTNLACVLTCKHPKMEIRDGSSGARNGTRSTLTGAIRWAVMASSIVSNMFASSDVKLQVHAHKAETRDGYHFSIQLLTFAKVAKAPSSSPADSSDELHQGLSLPFRDVQQKRDTLPLRAVRHLKEWTMPFYVPSLRQQASSLDLFSNQGEV